MELKELESLPESLVSTTGCSKHERIVVERVSLLERGLCLMVLVMRDAIVTQGGADASGSTRLVSGFLLAPCLVMPVHGSFSHVRSPNSPVEYAP